MLFLLSFSESHFDQNCEIMLLLPLFGLSSLVMWFFGVTAWAAKWMKSVAKEHLSFVMVSDGYFGSCTMFVLL